MQAITYPQTLLECDLETTGLDPMRHGILEAAFIHPASGERFAAKVDPRWVLGDVRGVCQFDPGALRVNGCMSCEALNDSDRYTLPAFMSRLLAWIEAAIPTGSIVLVGRNPGFDWSFLEEAADRALEAGEAAIFKARFGHRRLDTHGALMALAVARGWDVSVDRIDDLYRRLGLPAEQKPHTAELGVEHVHAGLELILREIGTGDAVNPQA
jgi:hypothetical protein